MTYRHASGTTPDGLCYACVVADEEWARLTGTTVEVPRHDPEPGTEDGLCWCGHEIEEVVPPEAA